MRSTRFSPRAFTLIEVTLSVGIFTTGLLAVVGLVGLSLNMLHEAGNRTTSTRIAEEIASEILLTSWEELSAYQPGGESVRMVFGDDGLELAPGDPMVIYVAEVEMTTDPDVHLPGAGGFSPGLRRLRVHVAHDPTGSVTYAESPDAFTTFAATVADMD